MTTPMNEDGYFSFALSSSQVYQMMKHSKIRIVEVNDQMPWIYGDETSMIHISDVDMIIEGESHPIAEQPDSPAPSDVAKKVAELVVGQLHDGVCLQLGIGGMPNTIGSMIAQSDLKDLAVHTEMYVDGFVDMALAGKLSMFPDFSNTDAVFSILVIPLAVQWWGVWKQGSEPGGGGYIVQRIMSAKSEGHAVGGTLFFNLVHYAIRPWPWYVVGFCSLIVFPELGDIQRAFPSVDPSLVKGDMAYSAMLTKVPAGWFGVVAASMMAALFSTIAAHLTMGSGYVVNDFYRRFVRPNASDRELIWAARATMVVFMVLACLIAPVLTSAKTAFDLMLLIGAGSGPIFLFRWFWMRINAWSEIVGILAALTTAIVLELVLPACGGPALAAWQKLMIGVGVTTVGWLTATFLTKPEPVEVQTRFKSLVRAKGRDVGLGVLYTFLTSVGIFATMFVVAWFLRRS